MKQLLGVLLVIPAPLLAQVRASERGSVSQTVDGTTITIEYSRPVARGRDSLFGKVVHWGEIWTPGANWATTMEVDKDFRLNDVPVPKGKYAVWMVPHATGTWTVLLDDNARKFHTQRPDTMKARVRFAVDPVQRNKIEILTWSFPEVRPDGVALEMQWGTTMIPLRVATGASPAVAPGRERLTPYLGSYKVAFLPEPGDTSKPFEIAVEVFEKDGHLRGRFSPVMPETDAEFDFLPTGEHTFTGRYYKGGKVFEQDEETVIVFQVDRGRATGFEMKFEDKPYARAQRVK